MTKREEEPQRFIDILLANLLTFASIAFATMSAFFLPHATGGAALAAAILGMLRREKAARIALIVALLVIILPVLLRALVGDGQS